MSVSNRTDESDRTTANSSMFKQRPGRMYAHIQNHNTVIQSDKAGKQPATPGRAAGINTPLAKQITTLNGGERDGASGYVKRTRCEWRRKVFKRRPYKAPLCLKRYQKRHAKLDVQLCLQVVDVDTDYSDGFPVGTTQTQEVNLKKWRNPNTELEVIELA